MSTPWLLAQAAAFLAIVAVPARRPLVRRWTRFRIRSWQPTKGVMDYAYVGRWRRWHVVSAGYSYRVAGKTNTGTWYEEFAARSYADSFCEYLRSVPASVCYDPSRPENSILKPAREPKGRPSQLRYPHVLDFLEVLSEPAVMLYFVIALVLGLKRDGNPVRARWRRWASRSWPLVPAGIESGEVETEPHGYRLVLTYSYRVGHRTYSGTWRWACETEAEALGLFENVKSVPGVVRYKPAEPQISVLDPFRDPTSTGRRMGQA